MGDPSPEWSLGEALTNLYVGLSRLRRGEKLSAMRLIQYHAVDRILELSEKIEPAACLVTRSLRRGSADTSNDILVDRRSLARIFSRL